MWAPVVAGYQAAQAQAAALQTSVSSHRRLAAAAESQQKGALGRHGQTGGSVVEGGDDGRDLSIAGADLQGQGALAYGRRAFTSNGRTSVTRSSRPRRRRPAEARTMAS